MRDGKWTAVLGIVLVIGLALGIVAWQGLQRQLNAVESVSPDRVAELSQQTDRVGSQLDDLTDRIGDLQRRISNIQSQFGSSTSADGTSSNGSDGTFKFAYVDMFQVLQDLQDSPLVAEPLKQYRQEQQRIERQKEEVRQQFQAGEITAQERDQRLSELDAQLQQLNLQLSAPIQQNMVEVIRQIGESENYDLVIDNPASQYNAIVLYSQSGQVDDITDRVVQQLTERLREEQGSDPGSDDGDEGSNEGTNGSESDGGTSESDE